MVPIARVRRAHGVRGELRVEPLLDAAVLAGLPRLTLQAPDGAQRQWEVAGVRPAAGPGGALLLSLVGLDDRDAADALRGAEVLAPKEALPALPAGEFWYHDLVGMAVVDADAGAALGTVRELFNAGASDVAVVDGPAAGGPAAGREWMLPIVDGVVEAIDVAGRRLVVRPLDGLIEGGAR